MAEIILELIQMCLLLSMIIFTCFYKEFPQQITQALHILETYCSYF